MTTSSRPARSQHGFSLIELMVAATIGLILLLAMTQVFITTRKAYELNEAQSRMQENGRLAMENLQRDVRMAGYMGCVNDGARLRNQEIYVHLTGATSSRSFAGVNFAENFSRPLEGFEATSTGVGGSVDLASTAGAWTPNLPTQLTGRVAPGSDVMVARYLGPTRATLVSVAPQGGGLRVTLNADAAGLVTANRVYALADCNRVSFFYATAVATGGLSFLATGVTGAEAFDANTAYLYETTSVAYFVGGTATDRQLFRMPLTSTAGAAPESLVGGALSFQALYGWDSSVPLPDGAVDQEGTAATLNTTSVGGQPAATRVGQVRVGLVMQQMGPEARQDLGTRADWQTVIGTRVRPAGRMGLHGVYETAAAPRNHLFGY